MYIFYLPSCSHRRCVIRWYVDTLEASQGITGERPFFRLLSCFYSDFLISLKTGVNE
jgi:hypothetical protein